MGYSASISGSSSATSGNKVSTGPVTFGGVSFGSAGGTSNTMMLAIAGAAVGLFFFLRK